MDVVLRCVNTKSRHIKTYQEGYHDVLCISMGNRCFVSVRIDAYQCISVCIGVYQCLLVLRIHAYQCISVCSYRCVSSVHIGAYWCVSVRIGVYQCVLVRIGAYLCGCLSQRAVHNLDRVVPYFYGPPLLLRKRLWRMNRGCSVCGLPQRVRHLDRAAPYFDGPPLPLRTPLRHLNRGWSICRVTSPACHHTHRFVRHLVHYKNRTTPSITHASVAYEQGVFRMWVTMKGVPFG
jgi:hypothetical protein